VLAEKYGLKIIPSLPVSPGISITSGNATLVDVSDRVASSKAFWGFDFYDEPTTKLFPALAKLAKQVGERYPGKLRFINLLPNYAASGTQLFAKNYTDYVDRFVTEMNADGAGPDIICMVRSPVRRPLLCTAIALNCTAPHRTALRLGSILCHIAIESWPDDHRTTTRSSRTSTGRTPPPLWQAIAQPSECCGLPRCARTCRALPLLPYTSHPACVLCAHHNHKQTYNRLDVPRAGSGISSMRCRSVGTLTRPTPRSGGRFSHPSRTGRKACSTFVTGALRDPACSTAVVA
jgi:hypothetical protein